MTEVEFTDRYRALGIPYPDPATMCQGKCEGTGWVPVFREGIIRSDITPLVQAAGKDLRLLERWDAAHAKPHDEPCDGWHFVVCPDCEGTRLRR